MPKAGDARLLMPGVGLAYAIESQLTEVMSRRAGTPIVAPQAWVSPLLHGRLAELGDHERPLMCWPNGRVIGHAEMQTPITPRDLEQALSTGFE